MAENKKEGLRPQSVPEKVDSHCLDCENGAKGKCGSCTTCGRAEPRGKLFGSNWLEGISDASDYDIVEVQFKNTRKGFYRLPPDLEVHIGDMVAVEASPGHDIGQVTMVGRLVKLHIKKANLKADHEFKRVFRIARPNDLERFAEAKAKEQDAMIRSRKIAEELKLNMKIGDVEYQGDGAKAIFYYIADERVDFRKLIRVLADTFKLRIEMKQIGARQEAGRIGGIGSCGRPLCCSSWMTGFVSVGTSAARFQDLSMNPQKLAGQCAKLKCCLNFEVDTYMEASRKLPPKDIPLETQDSTYYHFKSDILSGMMTYSTDKKSPVNCVTIPAERVREIIAVNKEGKKVESLEVALENSAPRKEFVELVGQDNINRFDKSKKKKKKRQSAKQQGAKQSGEGKQQTKLSGDAKQQSRQSVEGKQQKKGDDSQHTPKPKSERKDGAGQQRNKNNRKPKPQKAEKENEQKQ